MWKDRRGVKTVVSWYMFQKLMMRMLSPEKMLIERPLD